MTNHIVTRGIDVSNYQGHIDWSRVPRPEYEFAIAKATEGLGYQDPTFPHNWQGMKKYGFIRGAYHMLHYDTNGKDQADYHHAYVRASGHYSTHDFVMVDFERLGAMSTKGAVYSLVDFVEHALKSIYKQVVLYMDRWLWEELGNPIIPVLNQRPLVVPAYQVSPPPVIPGWPLVSFWQNSETGVVPGIQGFVDTDVFFGSRSQLLDVVKFPV